VKVPQIRDWKRALKGKVCEIMVHRGPKNGVKLHK
jgi:hypothetical protein